MLGERIDVAIVRAEESLEVLALGDRQPYASDARIDDIESAAFVDDAEIDFRLRPAVGRSARIDEHGGDDVVAGRVLDRTRDAQRLSGIGAEFRIVVRD